MKEMLSVRAGGVGWGGARQGVLDLVHSRSKYDHRPLHPDIAGTERVGFSPTRQTLLACTKREGP